MKYLDNTGLTYLWQKIKSGIDANKPSIDATTKNWLIGGVDTGIKAEGSGGTVDLIDEGTY